MRRTWRRKFQDAFVGIWLAVRSEHSFAIHVPMAIGVGIFAAILHVSLAEGCLLGLCVTFVLVAEVFNTALERLAQAIDRKENADIAAALDIASGAVLTASIGAALVGSAIFLHRVSQALDWAN